MVWWHVVVWLSGGGWFVVVCEVIWGWGVGVVAICCWIVCEAVGGVVSCYGGQLSNNSRRDINRTYFGLGFFLHFLIGHEKLHLL